MKKADIGLALLTGLVMAWFTMSLIRSSEAEQVFGIPVNLLQWILFLGLPVLAVICLWIAFAIGKKFPFVFQLAKFLLIGALATLFDLGILNFLITVFEKTEGLAFSVFKGISFLAATFAKYWANKFLAFEKKEMGEVQKEFAQFFVVTFVGLGLNVGVASLVVNALGPQFGLNPQVWASIGGIAAALAGFAWNFLGYKFIVFKK